MSCLLNIYFQSQGLNCHCTSNQIIFQFFWSMQNIKMKNVTREIKIRLKNIWSRLLNSETINLLGYYRICQTHFTLWISLIFIWIISSIIIFFPLVRAVTMVSSLITCLSLMCQSPKYLLWTRPWHPWMGWEMQGKARGALVAGQTVASPLTAWRQGVNLLEESFILLA